MEPIFLSDYTEDEKRAIMEALKKNKGKLTTLPDGGKAVNFFPSDLRDWFAGMAMAGMIRDGWGSSIGEDAYQIADTMLKARATPTEGER